MRHRAREPPGLACGVATQRLVVAAGFWRGGRSWRGGGANLRGGVASVSDVVAVRLGLSKRQGVAMVLVGASTADNSWMGQSGLLQHAGFARGVVPGLLHPCLGRPGMVGGVGARPE
jgi:hypothetical protein